MTTVVRPLPGNGVVAHEGGLLLVCGPAPENIVDRLLKTVQEVAAGGGNGRTAARLVAKVLAEVMTTGPVSCAVAGPADGGIAVLVSGTATAVVTGPGGEITLTGRSALTWTDRLIGGPVIRVVLRVDSGTDTSPADRRWRLDGGVMPGAGLACQWVETAPPPLVPEETAPVSDQTDPCLRGAPSTLLDEDVTAASVPAHSGGQRPPDAILVPGGDRQPFEEFRSQPFESVLLLPSRDQGAGSAPAPEPSAPAPQPDPRPLVWGADCKNGHFNDPRAPYCGVCGIGMAQLTLIPRQRPRPPLGVLLIDDGMALRLDADYLLGRDPEHANEVVSGEARPSRLADGEGSVSRRHVRISLKQWDVRLVDLGSVNGTYVMPPGEQTFVQIPPHEPVMIVPGTKVRVGGLRTFRYESHRK